MKKIKIGINGFGRIGRLILRASQSDSQIEIRAINDPFIDAEYAKYMLKYDSVHGIFDAKLEVEGENLIVNGQKIVFSSQKEPEDIKWANLGVDYVIECSGKFTKFEDASRHLKSGAKKVIVSAPGKNMPMFVMGVNETTYKSDMNIVSNASCTTNCLGPLAKIINDAFIIEEGLMTTIHSTTASQLTVDGPSKKDWRGGRASSINIIPSSTGAATAVGQVIPSLKGKLTGMSFRVPTVNVSVVDLTVKLIKSTTLEEIFKEVERASLNEMKGIVSFTSELLVSQDFVSDPHTCILDEKACIGLNDKFFKLVAWYDNEWGYSNKTLDLVKVMATVDKFN